MLSAALCVILIGFARAPAGDDDNLFIFPTAPGPSNNFVANLAFTLGSTQRIQWATTIESYYIALFQQEIDPPSGRQLETIYSMRMKQPTCIRASLILRAASEGNETGQQTLSWRVQLYDSSLRDSPVYFLWLNPGADDGFSSHYFNITISSSSASPSSTSSARPSSTTSTVPPSSVVASPTPSTLSAEMPTSIPTSPSRGDSSTPETLKVGLGVGLGIGIPLVLIAGIWIGLQAVKQRKAAHSSRDNSPSVPLAQFAHQGLWAPDPDKAILDAHTLHEASDTGNEPREMSAEGALIELGPNSPDRQKENLQKDRLGR